MPDPELSDKIEKMKKDLDNKEKEFKAKEREKAMIEGRIQQLEERLVTEFKIDSLEAAELEIDEMNREIIKMALKLEERYQELKRRIADAAGISDDPEFDPIQRGPAGTA